VALKELINTRGIKQKFIADKLGVSQVTVSNWVKGKTNPSEIYLVKLAEILEVSVDKLRHK
jgi:transcriptional regulator with XRE-family HTH domain